ncbi:MAG: hypothetical protein RIQ93_1217 [Verrucomicrobiota bacterium]|jgi:hypothetical protein
MNHRLLSLAVLGLTMGQPFFAAEESPPSSHMKEVLRARANEEAKKMPLIPTRPAVPKNGKGKAPETVSASTATPTTTPAITAAPKPPAQPLPSGKGEGATVLPQVEVRKNRITETHRQIQLQEQEIAREKKNTTSTETDRALNDSKVSSVLSIFGGESNKHRESVAQERVSLMEMERDMIEAMGRARTKEEKQELQKQLDETRATRRQLEKLRR